MITKGVDVSTADLNVEIAKNIDSILTSSEQSTDTFKLIKTPEIEIRTICEDDYSAYMVNNQEQRIDTAVFFSPLIMSGKEFYTIAKEYKMPMKITNVLYLFGSDNHYIFVNNTEDDLIEEVIYGLPTNMTYELINADELSDYSAKNFDTYTFIIINYTSFSITNLPTAPKLKKKSNAILIDFDGMNKEKGTITFYYFSDTEWQEKGDSLFIDDSMLYGAIFSGNKALYECNLKKLIGKSKPVYEIYNYTITRELELVRKTVCVTTYYPNALESIELIQESVDLGNLKELSLNAVQLYLTNKNLRSAGCPMVY
jgi:hypothetical protein